MNGDGWLSVWVSDLAEVLELSSEEYMDIINWIDEKGIEANEFICLVKKLIMEEIVK